MSSTNGFPFQATRRFVLSKIESQDSAFVISAIGLIDERRGWMASHKVRAGRLVAKISAGDLSPEDLAEAAALMKPYARTLARVLREKEMAERPELMSVASVFGMVRPAPATPTVPTGTIVQAEAAIVSTTAEAPVVAPKRRGRPPGSKKNKKPCSEPEQPKRRRRS